MIKAHRDARESATERPLRLETRKKGGGVRNESQGNHDAVRTGSKAPDDPTTSKNMGIIYVERNGRRYAYEASSKRVPGKANPVSKMTYLGVVDPATGEITRKRGTGTPGITVTDGGFENKGLGDVLIAWSVAEGLGLPRVLESVFGDGWRGILALALAQATRPSPMADASVTISSTCIPELVGMGRKGLRRTTEDALHSITIERTEEAQRCLRRCSVGRTYVFNIGFDLFGRNPSIEGRIRKLGPPSLGNFNVNILVDGRGLPVSYHFSSESGKEPRKHLDGLSRILDEGGFTVVSDSHMESPAYILGLMASGHDFAVSCDMKDPSLRWLLDGFLDGADEPDHFVRFNGETCPAYHTAVGVVLSKDGWEYVPPTDPRFMGCRAKLMAFAYRSARARRADVRNLDSCIAAARAVIADTPENGLPAYILDMGAFTGFIDVTGDPDGGTSIRLRKDMISEVKRAAGVYGVLTSLDCDDAMRAFEIRDSVIDDLSSFLYEIDGHWEHRSRHGPAHENLFVHFLAGMIRNGIGRRLEGTGLSTDEALHMAATFTAMDVGGRMLVSKKSMKVTRILGMFGIDDFDGNRLGADGGAADR